MGCGQRKRRESQAVGVRAGLESGSDRKGGERSEGLMGKEDSGLLAEAGGVDGRERRKTWDGLH